MRLFLMALFILSTSISAWAMANSHQVQVFCASPGDMIIKSCGVNFEVTHVQLVQQTPGSSGECTPDIDYGYSGTAMWVTSGCQGYFVVTGQDW